MATSFTHFGGVDFSGAREPLSNLWTALGVAANGRLEIRSIRPHAFRSDLGAFVASGWRDAVNADEGEAVLWGVDFACGLPAAATRHLLPDGGSWTDALAWVADRPADEVKDAIPEELRASRLTDGGAAAAPLEVRSYRQTVEGLRWLHELREEHDIALCPQAAVPPARCTLVEVSPAVTTVDLGLPRRRAPGRPGEYRARAAALRTFLSFAHPEIETIAVTLEDAWDATLACLTAFLVQEDLEQPLRSRHPPEMLALEGWIYRAPAALEA